MKKKNGSAKSSKAINIRPFSSILVDGPERAAARAMLYPVGFTEADFKKPIIGIASTWSNVTPCNMHIDKLALEAEKGANAGGGKAIIFNTITISDGISMGSEGMKYSLVSRPATAGSSPTPSKSPKLSGLRRHGRLRGDDEVSGGNELNQLGSTGFNFRQNLPIERTTTFN